MLGWLVDIYFWVDIMFFLRASHTERLSSDIEV